MLHDEKRIGWWYLFGKLNRKLITNIPNKIYYWKTKWFWIEGENDSWEFGDPSVDPDRSDLIKRIDCSGLDDFLVPISRLTAGDKDSEVVITLPNLATYILRADLLLPAISLSYSPTDGGSVMLPTAFTTSLRSSCKRVLDLPSRSPLKKKTL